MDNLKEYEIKDLKYKDTYRTIVDRYRDIDKCIRNIQLDIKKLNNIHHKYINSEELESINYSTYVDDIKYQLTSINKEYLFLYDIYQSNLNKLYRDLFKLYTKTCKSLINIYKENKDNVIRIWNSTDKVIDETINYKKFKKVIRHISENTRISGSSSEIKIFDEIRKYYFINIKILNEINTNINYDFNDIDNIFNKLDNRINELRLSDELIKINISDIKIKTDKGILGQTFMIDLNGRLNKIIIEYNIIINILFSILNMHLDITEKYKKISVTIANSVIYDEDSIESIKVTNDTDNKIDDKTDDNRDLFVSQYDI